MKRFFFYWLPPLALMMTIFLLSERQSISVSPMFTVNFIVFKSLHMIEYALLFFLVFRAFSGTLLKQQKQQALVLAILVAICYGIFDELHQTFVPTRNGSIIDVGIDTVGILLMFQYTKNNLSKLKRIL